MRDKPTRPQFSLAVTPGNLQQWKKKDWKIMLKGAHRQTSRQEFHLRVFLKGTYAGYRRALSISFLFAQSWDGNEYKS